MPKVRSSMSKTSPVEDSRQRSILWHLVVFGASVVLPILIFVALVLWKYAHIERARLEDQTLTRARAVASAMNEEIAGLAASLQNLSASPGLRERDFPRIESLLNQASDEAGILAFVWDTAGNVRAAPRRFASKTIAPLPSIANEAFVQANSRFSISNYFVDPVSHAAGFLINVISQSPGAEPLTLSMIIPATRLRGLLDLTVSPPEWEIGILDRDGIVLARNHDFESYVGKPGVSDFVAHSGEREGAWTGESLMGVPTFVSYARSTGTNWRVTVGVSVAELEAPLRNSLVLLAMLGIALALLAGLLALSVGRRITNALRRLTLDTAMMQSGHAPSQLSTRIDEINIVGRGLAQVARGLRQRGDELTASKERLSRMLDATPSGIIEVASDGTVTYCNRMIQTLLGMDANAIVGVDYRTLIKSAADAEGNPLEFEDLPLARALRGLSTSGFEQALVTSTGLKMNLSINAEPIHAADGALVGALAAVADVTTRFQADAALRQSERRMRGIVDTVPVGIVVADAPGGDVVETNAAIHAILRNKPGSATGPRFYEEWVSFHEDGRTVAPTEYPLARALTGKEERPELECRYLRPDGSFVWIKITGAPLRGRSNAVVGAIMAVSDINDIKQSQSQQRLMNRELHHRVKNTLATVQAIANLTSRSVKDIEAFRKTFADRIVSLSRTHTLLVENSWEFVPMGELARLELGSYRTSENDQISLEGSETWIPSDIGLAIGMALHELTANALQFGALSTPAGHVTLRWHTQKSAEKTQLFLYWIEERGPLVLPPTRRGFGSQLLNNILARQLKGEIKIDYAPTGLTVSIVTDI